MAVSKLYRTCGQTLLTVIMFNYYICMYNNVCERNGNKICLNYWLWSIWMNIAVTDEPLFRWPYFHIGDLFNLYKSPFYVKGLLEDLTKLKVCWVVQSNNINSINRLLLKLYQVLLTVEWTHGKIHVLKRKTNASLTRFAESIYCQLICHSSEEQHIRYSSLMLS